jgi:hypothetical protein
MPLVEQAKKDWPSVIVVLLGAWVVASPFIFEGTSVGTTFSNLFTGIFLIVYGGYDVYQKQIWGQRLARYWAMATLALWTIGSPYLLLSISAIKTGNLVVGVVVLVAAGYQLYRKTDRNISVGSEDSGA